MSNRRKAITYGKSSRKITSDYSSFEANEPIQVNDRDNWYDSTQSTKEIDISSTESVSPQSHPDCQRRSPLTSPEKPTYKIRSSLFAASATKQLSGIHELKEVLPSQEDKSFFEVPSSDGEEYVPSEYNKMRRKRRKTANTALFDEANIVYDDESLQRHVAAEVDQEQTKYQDPQNAAKIHNTIRIKQHPLIPSTHHPVPRNPEDMRLAERWVTWVETEPAKNDFNQGQHGQSFAVDTNGDTAKKDWETKTMKMGSQMVHIADEATILHRKSTKRRDKSDPRSRSHMSQINTSALQAGHPGSSETHSVADDVALSTTTRQLGLSDIPSNDNFPDATPSSPEAPTSATKYQNGHREKNAQSVPQQFSLQETSKGPRKGQRIIDHLNRHSDRADHTNKASSRPAVSEIHDSSIDKASHPSSLNSPILIPPSSIDKKRTATPRDENSRIQKVQPASINPGRGLKVTYARQRSYLNGEESSQTTVFDMPVADHVHEFNLSRQSPDNTLSGFQANEVFDENADEASNNQSGTMRSIHELRKAGSNARLIGEMEAMLDDIDKENIPSISQTRARLLELAMKLQEPAFCQLFIDQGLDLRLFAQIDPNTDLIVGGLYASAALQILAPSISIPRLSLISGSCVLRSLIGLLDKGQDLTFVTRRRDIHMSKATQVGLENLWLSLLAPTVWKTDKPPVLTVRVLCLQCLDSFMRHARESACIPIIVLEEMILRVSRILDFDFSSSVKQPDSKSLVDIQLAISVLESCKISDLDTSGGKIWSVVTREHVIKLLPHMRFWPKEKAGTLRTLTLRLYLNLTNNNPVLCEQFARPDVVGADRKSVV